MGGKKKKAWNDAYVFGVASWAAVRSDSGTVKASCYERFVAFPGRVPCYLTRKDGKEGRRGHGWCPASVV